MEIRKSGVQTQPWLQSISYSSLGGMRPYLKNTAPPRAFSHPQLLVHPHTPGHRELSGFQRALSHFYELKRYDLKSLTLILTEAQKH